MKLNIYMGFPFHIQRKNRQELQSRPNLLSYHLQRALRDYEDEFALPEYVGFSGKTISQLKARIESRKSVAVREVAEDLGLTSHTLHRRLVSEGSTFQHILDIVRRHFAFHLLIQGLSQDEISERLFFDNTQVFTISFIRWTGLDPQAFKRLFC